MTWHYLALTNTWQRWVFTQHHNYLLGSQDAEEHVKGHLDRVEVDQSMLGGNELEVNGMDKGPDLPTGLTCRQEIRLDLVGNGGKRVAIDEAEIGEKDSHENGAPKDLVNGNLGGNVLGRLSWDLLVEPAVKVVARRSVVKKTKGRESDESLPVEWSTADKDLGEPTRRRFKT